MAKASVEQNRRWPEQRSHRSGIASTFPHSRAVWSDPTFSPTVCDPAIQTWPVVIHEMPRILNTPIHRIHFLTHENEICHPYSHAGRTSVENGHENCITWSLRLLIHPLK